MENARPRITTVVALLNRRGTLERCIDSVLAQSHPQHELIVIDGGSTDGSAELLRGYAPRLGYWESAPDRGIAHAFNKAVAKARGDWIHFLGADDWLWDRDVLQNMDPHLAGAHPAHRVVYAQINFVSASGEVLERLGEPWSTFRRRFFQGHIIPHLAVFHHRTLFEARGEYSERLRWAADYEMLLRELKHSEPLHVPGIVIAAFQFGGQSSAPGDTLKVLRETRLALEMNGIGFPGVLWYAALARALIRLALWKLVGERATKRLLDWGRALMGKPAFWTRI